jgi:hypothetical protein
VSEVAGASRALITQTLLHNASLICDDPVAFTLDRLFDLSSLVEATVLFDQLFAIESSNTLPAYQLSRALVSAGVVANDLPAVALDDYWHFCRQAPDVAPGTRIFWAKGVSPKDPRLEDSAAVTGAGDAATDPSGHGSPFNRYDLRPTDWRGGYVPNPAARASADEETPTLWVPNSYYAFADLPSQYLMPTTTPTAGTPEDLMAWTKDLRLYPSIPDEVRASSWYIARTRGYLVLCGLADCDYYPDFLRVPYTVGHLRQMHRSVTREVYAKLAAALVADVEELSSLSGSCTVPIPPLTALIFGRIASLDEFPRALLELRDEYAQVRDAFASLKAQMGAASSLQERTQALNKYRELLSEMSRETSDIITLKPALNLAEALVRPVVAPGAPTSYSANLISLPAAALRRWWTRRRFAVLFRADRQVRELATYDKQLRKLWGHRIAGHVLVRYGEYIATVRSVLQVDEVNA